MSDRIQAGQTQKGFTRGPIIAPAEPRQQVWEQDVDQQCALGCKYALDDGRVYHYAQAGAVALDSGELQQSALYGGSSATVQTDLTPTAAAIGVKDVTVTLATDAATFNQYADGWLAVSDGGVDIGQGEMYKIVGNDVGSAGSTCVLHLDRGLKTAWTSSTRVSINTNLYKLLIQCPVTTPTGLVMGVPNIEVDINYYFWLQTWGMCNLLIKTALTMGTNVLLDVAAAGSGGVDDGALVNTVIGAAGLVVATTDSGMVYLKIAR